MNGPRLEISAKVHLLSPKGLEPKYGCSPKGEGHELGNKNAREPTAQRTHEFNRTLIKPEPFLTRLETVREQWTTPRKFTTERMPDKEKEQLKTVTLEEHTNTSPTPTLRTR